MRAIAMLMSPFHWVRSSHWKRRVEHFCSTRSAPTRGVPSTPRHSSVPSTRMLGLFPASFQRHVTAVVPFVLLVSGDASDTYKVTGAPSTASLGDRYQMSEPPLSNLTYAPVSSERTLARIGRRARR